MGYRIAFVITVVLGSTSLGYAGESAERSGDSSKAEVGTLAYVDSVTGDDWNGVASISLSNDQKHAYAAAFDTAAILVFNRDAATGRLELIQTISGRDDYNGVTSVRLSPDGRYAVSAAFRSDRVVLFRRDLDSGKLNVLDKVRRTPGSRWKFFGERPEVEEEDESFHRSQEDDCAVIPYRDLAFVIEAVFAPDSRVVYALGCQSETVVSFRVTEEEKLDLVEVIGSVDHSFANARGVVVTPDAKSIYVASQRGNTFSVLDRDPDTGEAEIAQICRDEEGEFHALQGAFSVACSSDGQFVYVSSGLFGGDDAVSVYRRNADGTVALVQEMFNDTGQLHDFEGGNEILVSPDGCNVYAVGTTSNTLVAFRRDAKTGKIEPIQTLKDQTNGVGPLKGASGLAISLDGLFVYAAVSDAISIFRRRVPQAEPTAE